MKKAVTYTGFALTGFLEVFAFVSANTYIQLGIAVVFYPLLAYFAYRLFFHKKDDYSETTTLVPEIKTVQSKDNETGLLETGDVNISDIDKRAFLKLIGVAGITLFLSSIFSRRSQDLFLGGGSPGTTALEDSFGNKINPAESQPTDGYRISEIDENESTFYGFTNQVGGWFIMRENDDGSFRYIKGDSNFPGNWANRENLKYDYYHNAFA